MSNKGFTLIEMLLILGILSIFLCLFPFLRPNASLQLHYEVQTLYERLLFAQGKAIAQKVDKHVDFHGFQYTIDQSTYTLKSNMYCKAPSFHFTAQGTISNALTIRCKCQDFTKQIVLQLGSGRMYVK